MKVLGRRVFPLLVTALVAAAALTPVHVLTVDAPQRGGNVFLQGIHAGDRFTLTYLHSVERCPIADTYRVDDRFRIVQEETAFASSNTGLPTGPAPGERFLAEPGTFRIRNMHRILPEIRLWVHADYANTLQMAGGENVALASLAGNTLLTVRSRRMPFASFWYERIRLFFHKGEAHGSPEEN